ncbi:MAG: sulfurtransferase TusA family protein [Candidatus Fervidibacter sp.]|uniref:sulfurtransferase TusA family protein n=1 Tax=Candidatus Fervidibacter sp. TaxID=3100871 RepID=UPI00404AF105
MALPFDKELDVRGAKCPIPVVKARQATNELSVGQVLRVLSTDPGSVNDFKGWAQVAKNIELLAQETETMDGQTVYVHYVKRTA